MKNIIAAIFILIILFNGCKKDENIIPPENIILPENFIKYNNTYFELSSGWLDYYPEYSYESENIGLSLISSGIGFIESDGEVTQFYGNGHCIFFNLYTPYPDKIDVGNYQYDEYWSEESGTYDDAVVYLNFNLSRESGTVLMIRNGILSILQNEGEYEITFDCIAEDGKSITGYYKGKLNYYISQFLDQLKVK